MQRPLAAKKLSGRGQTLTAPTKTFYILMTMNSGLPDCLTRIIHEGS
jgi:hypothetical protein